MQENRDERGSDEARVGEPDREREPEEAESTKEEDEAGAPRADSKYRLIVVAAQRSKRLQKGARPRVRMDAERHKPTRIALEEAREIKALNEPSAIGLERIKSAVEEVAKGKDS
jgi:DNA-directed RNA polymerase omega subunit